MFLSRSQTSFSESPITEIFGGEVRSAVHRHGAKESATVEPFFSLQLDIQVGCPHSKYWSHSIPILVPFHSLLVPFPFPFPLIDWPHSITDSFLMYIIKFCCSVLI